MTGNDCLLDTNAVILFLNGDPNIINLFSNLTRLNIPVIVVGELFYGAYNSKKHSHNLEILHSILNTAFIIGTDEITAMHYGKIKSELKSKGTPIPENDIWISALARLYKMKVITRDAHFNNIEKMELISW